MKNKFRFTIARKLSLGFGVLLIAVLSTSFLTWYTLDKNMKINNKVNKIYNPSATKLKDLFFIVTTSKMLIKSWVNEEKDDTPDKLKLKEVHNKQYPTIKKELVKLTPSWKIEDREQYKAIIRKVDSLFDMHKNIMQKLDNYDAYSEVQTIFTILPQIDNTGEIILLTDEVYVMLDKLVKKQETNVLKANKEMDASFHRFNSLIVLMALILLISVLLIAIFTTRTLTMPINYIKNILLSMSKGILPEKTIKSRTDEIGEMANALNQLVKGLKTTSEFSLKIGDGNYNSEFKPLSSKDVLGNSLIIMRENLKKAVKESELRRKENNQRTWASQGIAMFSEILRKNNDNIEEFSYEIISNIVKYLDANQGGLFIVNNTNEEDNFLELKACYAFERRKYLKKRIEIGVTIVGQCVLEKETIYMTDIPDNYIRITSGLGEDSPTSLLVVPLISNDKVYGVVEIASFNKFEKYQIEFVEKVGENIASTVQTIKINNNTARLLHESREKSERLAIQEEEMRRKIKEMETAQEEMIEKHDKKNKKIQQEYEQKLILLQNKITELEKK